MTQCYVCESPIEAFALSLAAPALSSLTTEIDVPTRVAVCDRCGHGQSPEPVELASFYDVEYRISLQSDEFDQLYATVDGNPQYRTEKQLEVLLGMVDVFDGCRVLDYGAAKAQSLKRLIGARPGIVPHVFDISQDYQAHWDVFLPRERTATYDLPAAWNGQFDLITTYFVLEHIADPTTHLRRLRDMLAPGGRLFVMVPNALTNTGDLLVVDHVNHFTVPSLVQACALSGLQVEKIDERGFVGAVAIVAMAAEAPTGSAADDIAEAAKALRAACDAWGAIDAHLVRALSDRPNGKFALHGAGFYGAFTMQRLKNNLSLAYVLDANPYLQGGDFFGRPVLAPSELPSDVDTVFVALNPATARRIVGDGGIYGRTGIDAVFLDGV